MFCFKQSQLLKAPDSAAFFRKLGFARINASTLNPLKVCTLDVVLEFAKLTSLFTSDRSIDAIIERNRRVFLKTSSRLQGSRNRLDPFFPFDPYNLPLSSVFLTDSYVCWRERQLPSSFPVSHDDSQSAWEPDNSDDDTSEILSPSFKPCSLSDDDDDDARLLSSTPDVFSDLNFC